jgi:hypothetical protein
LPILCSFRGSLAASSRLGKRVKNAGRNTAWV